MVRCDFYIFCFNRSFMVRFGCDLALNELVILLVSDLGLSSFIFGVILCLLVWFGVICISFEGNQCFLV